MAANTESTERKHPNAPWFIKAFVAFHVVAITSWSLPNAKPEQVAGQANPPATAVGDWLRIYNKRYVQRFPPIQGYMTTSGFWQYWDMFAPNPSQTDIYGDAVVVYKDGATKNYAFPRMYSLSVHNRYAQERYRKFFERASGNDFTFLRPPLALRIAYLNDDIKNPPVKVRLFRHWLPIAPPGQPQQKEYGSVMFYEYWVDQNALARMRKGG